MNDRPDYYDVLRVARNASTRAIRDSYRRLMQQPGIHPDRGGDAAMAAAINKAYAVLVDPLQRRQYDAQRAPIEPAAAPVNACPFCGQLHQRTLVEIPERVCRRCDSPLTLPGNLPVQNSDQRGLYRVDKSLDLEFVTNWQQCNAFAARIENISLNGLRMVTRHSLLAGQRIRLVCDLVKAVGTIVYSDRMRGASRREYKVGVAFVTQSILNYRGVLVSQRA